MTDRPEGIKALAYRAFEVAGLLRLSANPRMGFRPDWVRRDAKELRSLAYEILSELDNIAIEEGQKTYTEVK